MHNTIVLWLIMIIKILVFQREFPRHTQIFNRYYPVKDRTKLTMIWFLKPQQKHYLTKPGDYVAWCIGHEGKGSLLSALKSKVK